MPLSDTEIISAIERRDIQIDPFKTDAVQAASYDIRLGTQARIIEGSNPLDLTSDADLSERFKLIDISTPYTIPPGGFLLGSCMEKVVIGGHFGIVVNRSSIARAGLDCTTSSYLNPGYEGTPPLVLINLTNVPIKIVAGRRVAQILFFKVGEVTMSYKDRGGKYLGEKGPTASKHHLDIDLQRALGALGLSGRKLERVSEILDRRLDKLAEEAIKTFNKGE